MLDFIIGFILGGFFGIMLISIVIVGKEREKKERIKENELH